MRGRATLGVALSLAACGGGGGDATRAHGPLPTTPAEFRQGESLYVANCALCHGPGASGTAQGPPLAHRYYEPSHHGDAAFALAVRVGVVAHHWRFGNMPPQPHVSDEHVSQITSYVRWVQRQRGIE